MKLDNIELVFEEDAVKAVAQRSIQLKTGARGLRSVLENVMLDFMFDAPNDKSITKVVVDKNCIEGKDKPRVYRQASQLQKADCFQSALIFACVFENIIL